MRGIASRFGIDLDREIRNAGIDATVWNIPFVYIFERSDFTVKLSGANIFPEEVRRALEHPSLQRCVTGKCTMQIRYDNHLNQALTIHVEMKRDARDSLVLRQEICDRIVMDLRNNNSEYAYLFTHIPKKRMIPKIRLWLYGAAPHFGVPGKHRWVRKQGE